MIPSTSSERVETVELMRGLAALSVAWFHFTQGNGLLSEGWLRDTGKFGWLGVEVFFVISGFILPYSMLRSGYVFPRHYFRFILKRLIRLDPPYFAAVLLTIALWYASSMTPGFAGQPPSVTFPQFALHIGYLNAFFGYPWIIPVFWTLAIEFQFYLLIGILLPLLANRRFPLRACTLIAISIAGSVFDNPALLAGYLNLFLLGIVLCLYRTGRIGAVEFAVFVIIATIANGIKGAGFSVAIVGLLALGMIGFVKIPQNATIRFFGTISYSVYLLHVPIGGRVMNLGARFAFTLPLQCLVLCAAVLSSLGAAWIMYRLIERPAQLLSSSLKYR